jgi:hypothetical protein
VLLGEHHAAPAMNRVQQQIAHLIKEVTQIKKTGNKTPWSCTFKELFSLQSILIYILF